MFSNLTGQKTSLKDRMMAYINERYDDTFTYVTRWQFDTAGTTIAVKSEKYPDERIQVRYIKGAEKEYIGDDYQYYVFKEQTIDALNEVLDKAFCYDYKMLYDGPPAIGNKMLAADVTFDEYIASDISHIGFTAVLAPGYDIGEPDEFEEKLKGAFASRNMIVMNAAIRFCEDTEADIYNSLTGEIMNLHGVALNKPVLRLFDVGTDREDIYWREMV